MAGIIESNSWLVYTAPVPASNKRYQLLQEDIDEAFAAYKRDTGHLPAIIQLAARNDSGRLELHGLEPRYSNGTLANEIWLADAVPVPVPRGNFNSLRAEKEAAGPDVFFCRACLTYHSVQEKQPKHPYCKAAYYFIKNESSEIPVTDGPPTPALSDSSGVENLNVTTTPIETTPGLDSTPVNVTKKNRKLRVDIPEDEIRKSKESGQVLANRYQVSRMTISRIRNGQRVLV